MGTKTTNYKRAFNAANYDRMEITVPKGKKEFLQAHSKNMGESLNGFVNRAIDEAVSCDIDKLYGLSSSKESETK